MRIYFEVAVLALSLLLASCGRPPAPSAQSASEASDLTPRSMLDMGDPSVDAWIIADVSRGPNSAPWRWTGQRPMVRVRPASTTPNTKLHVEFTVADATFKDTGPVTIAFLVNDHPLDKVRYAEAGSKKFEKVIPAGWLRPGEENALAADIDKVWISPRDGAKLGIILSKIGLVD